MHKYYEYWKNRNNFRERERELSIRNIVKSKAFVNE